LGPETLLKTGICSFLCTDSPCRFESCQCQSIHPGKTGAPKRGNETKRGKTKMKVFTYLIYIIFWESLTIGGFSYLIFFKGISEVWFIVAIVLSAMGYKPSEWGKLFIQKNRWGKNE
jgi:hypothetical protein